jgi:DegV family protein with EDD domain
VPLASHAWSGKEGLSLPATRSKVAIVTDSTADISPQEAQALGVTVVPITVVFGERAYLDGVDITPPQFYELLGKSSALPRTDPPDPTRFFTVYTHLLAQGATGVVSLHLSGRLGATLQSARQAAQAFGPGAPIAVVDSGQVGVGLLPAVRFAAQMAQVGAPRDVIQSAVADTLSRTHLYFLVETLEYLQKGGRIGRAQRLLGTLLDAKPLLTIQEGEVAPVETVRPRERAHQRLAELVHGLGAIGEIYIGQTNDALGEDVARDLGRFFAGPIHRGWIGATVGTHMGSGVAIGAVLAPGARGRASHAY